MYGWNMRRSSEWWSTIKNPTETIETQKIDHKIAIFCVAFCYSRFLEKEVEKKTAKLDEVTSTNCMRIDVVGT